jgi:hypothetical protein
MTLNDKYESSYFGRLANCLSQLAHTISGGAADVSISGKTGYKTFVKKSDWWESLRVIVDFAFKPIDGVDHCKNAYMVDKNEKYHIGEGLIQDIICSIFVIIFCPIISIFSYTYLAVRNMINKAFSLVNKKSV